jgi:hypothetical protein
MEGNAYGPDALVSCQLWHPKRRRLSPCSCIFDLRCLDVEHDGGSIVLRGRVNSFYYKQLAQELVGRRR